MIARKEFLRQTTLPLFEEDTDTAGSISEKEITVEKTNQTEKKDTTSTFADNLSRPIHKWFRYSAGFSANWVQDLIQQEKSKGRSKILDPFSGSGTVPLASELCDVESIGIEAHPFIARVANAKLQWQQDPKSFSSYALSILKKAETSEVELQDPPELIKKCFLPETLTRLETLRIMWEASADNSPLSELTWLALASILRSCSPVGTAQWQYILPSKSKAKTLDPYEAFRAKVQLMAEDMSWYQRQAKERKSTIYWGDARECSQVSDSWADLVITSPPYANNYDYADATRLEMSFFRDIQGWGNLQDAVRKHLVRSCTQHVGNLSKETYHMIANPLLSSIQEELSKACKELEAEKENHGGKKQYHTMIATYFTDMANVWIALRRVTRQGSLICFVIGDSAPYGIYVPVDRWLGELAIAAGFKSYAFEKMRDRNIKWKNRKHTVPLHEGRLWIEG